jgi:hypothetical protein
MSWQDTLVHSSSRMGGQTAMMRDSLLAPFDKHRPAILLGGICLCAHLWLNGHIICDRGAINLVLQPRDRP